MSPEIELLLKVLRGIGMLVLPFAVLGFVSHYSSKIAAERVGRDYCETNRYEFLAVEIKKANYTLKYRSASELALQKF